MVHYVKAFSSIIFVKKIVFHPTMGYMPTVRTMYTRVYLSFIYPSLGGFREILPEMMIFPEGMLY